MQMDPTAAEIPEPSPPPPAIEPSFRKAGFWRRVLAYVIDSIILGMGGWVLGFLFADIFIRMGGWERGIGFAIALLYLAPLNSRLGGGQTIGKRAVGIRVVSKPGALLGLGRSVARSAVLMLPYFLNGMPIPLEFIQAGGGDLVWVIVFGGGLAILYLLAFNARTGQSLHDLAVGSYVVRTGSEAAEKPRMWAGHYFVVALIPTLIGAGSLLLTRFVKDLIPKEIFRAHDAMMREPEVASAMVMAGQQVFFGANGQRVSTGVTASVRLNRRIQNQEEEARKLVRILLDGYPDAATKDSITVTLVEGYDLGIASWFSRRVQLFDRRMASTTGVGIASAESAAEIVAVLARQGRRDDRLPYNSITSTSTSKGKMGESQPLLGSFGNVIPIPFPGLAVVGRERLTPDRTVLIPRVPAEHHDDWFSLEGVLRKKVPDTVLKGTDHRWVQDADIAGDPIETPESGFRIEEPERDAFERFSLLPGHLGGGISIHVGRAAEDLGILIGGFKFRPLLTAFQAFVEPAVVHLPFPDQEIEVARRGGGRRGDLEFSPGVKAQLRNWEGAISGENRFLRLGQVRKDNQKNGK
jgi:uncharacterized RDD family membrane protein YckC